MKPVGLLPGSALTAGGLAVSGLGLYLLIVMAKLDTGSTAGWVAIGVVSVGLLLVATGGSIWRLSGGWMRNLWSRRSRERFVPRGEDD